VPVDGYGVGTAVVTGAGAPSAGFVYKAVAVDGRAVAKLSLGKATTGGRKHAVRLLDGDGRARGEALNDAPFAPDAGRPLQVPLMRHGRAVHAPSLDEVRAHHQMAMAELPDDARRLDDGPPAFLAAPQKEES
jgi:nicotinate phosphoribosyltransferase